MARPKKDPSLVKSVTRSVRLSEADLALLERYGLTLQAVVDQRINMIKEKNNTDKKSVP